MSQNLPGRGSYVAGGVVVGGVAPMDESMTPFGKPTMFGSRFEKPTRVEHAEKDLEEYKKLREGLVVDNPDPAIKHVTKQVSDHHCEMARFACVMTDAGYDATPAGGRKARNDHKMSVKGLGSLRAQVEELEDEIQELEFKKEHAAKAHDAYKRMKRSFRKVTSLAGTIKHALNTKVIAECVETYKHARNLQDLDEAFIEERRAAKKHKISHPTY